MNKARAIGTPVERAIAVLDPDSREALEVEVATLRAENAQLRETVEAGYLAAALIILAFGKTEVRIPSVLMVTQERDRPGLWTKADPVTGDIIFRVRRGD